MRGITVYLEGVKGSTVPAPDPDLNVTSCGRSGTSAAYAASKHAVIGLRRSTAIPAGKRGIRVNSLHPGFVESPMLTRLMSQRGDLDEVRKEMTARIKLGRFTDAEEIANAALFLGSDESKGMTDQMLVIDGGVV